MIQRKNRAITVNVLECRLLGVPPKRLLLPPPHYRQSELPGCTAMFSNGYVGSSEDSQRIRRQEKQREEQRKKFETLAQESKDRADGAGLRQFGTSTEEVCTL